MITKNDNHECLQKSTFLNKSHRMRQSLKYKGISFYIVWNTFVNAVNTGQPIIRTTRSIWSQRSTKSYPKSLFANIAKKSSRLNNQCIGISSTPVKRTTTKI